ncbi:MAG: amino acid ABC transporter ATP-binding protein [Lactovum sp.]
MMTILSLTNIHKSFAQHEVLKGIDFSVNEGEVVTLIGSSGSGKSTLLRCINLLEQPEQGEINFQGQEILSGDLNLDQFRSQLGMVFQNFNLFENMTVLQNCTLAPIKVLGLSSEEARKRAIKHLKNVGLSDFIHAKSLSLSGGQKQRVAIARALSMNPKLLLFDEPTSALDPEMVGEVLTVIKAIADKGMTLLIVTHEMQFAAEVSDRVVYMREGQIEYITDSQTMFNQPENENARQFLKRIL